MNTSSSTTSSLKLQWNQPSTSETAIGYLARQEQCPIFFATNTSLSYDECVQYRLDFHPKCPIIVKYNPNEYIQSNRLSLVKLSFNLNKLLDSMGKDNCVDLPSQLKTKLFLLSKFFNRGEKIMKQNIENIDKGQSKTLEASLNSLSINSENDNSNNAIQVDLFWLVSDISHIHSTPKELQTPNIYMHPQITSSTTVNLSQHAWFYDDFDIEKSAENNIRYDASIHTGLYTYSTYDEDVGIEANVNFTNSPSSLASSSTSPNKDMKKDKTSLNNFKTNEKDKDVIVAYNHNSISGVCPNNSFKKIHFQRTHAEPVILHRAKGYAGKLGQLACSPNNCRFDVERTPSGISSCWSLSSFIAPKAPGKGIDSAMIGRKPKIAITLHWIITDQNHAQLIDDIQRQPDIVTIKDYIFRLKQIFNAEEHLFMKHLVNFFQLEQSMKIKTQYNKEVNDDSIDSKVSTYSTSIGEEPDIRTTKSKQNGKTQIDEIDKWGRCETLWQDVDFTDPPPPKDRGQNNERQHDKRNQYRRNNGGTFNSQKKGY